MKAVFLDFATMGPNLDLAPLSGPLPDLELFDATPDDLLARRIGNAEFVFVNKVRLTDEHLDTASKLRFIGLAATGSDNVDLDSARRRAIAVTNIRDYCTSSVTEHVFGVLLMLTHNLHRYAAAVREGAWQRSREFCLHDFPVRELSSMTLGIIGYGALGRSVAAMAGNFGMDVVVAARPGGKERPAGRESLDDLLQRADVVSLHCPLTPDTRGLLGEREFAAMKSSAILINTARGGLVDSAALVGALQRGDIAAAAIDVLPAEPPVPGDPLLDYDGDNLVVTPHIAWSTERARQSCIDEMAANVRSFLDGGDRNRIV